MRVGINSQLSSILVFSTDLKELSSKHWQTIYSGDLEQVKPLQIIGQAAEFKFEFKFKSLQVMMNKVIPEDIPRF